MQMAAPHDNGEITATTGRTTGVFGGAENTFDNTFEQGHI